MRSKENIKVMRDIFGAIERRDERRFLELVHPDCAMHWPPSLPYGGTARGLQPEVQPGATHGVPCNRLRLSAGWSRALWRRARMRSSCSGASEASPRPETALTERCWACITSVEGSSPAPRCSTSIPRRYQLLGEGQGQATAPQP